MKRKNAPAQDPDVLTGDSRHITGPGSRLSFTLRRFNGGLLIERSRTSSTGGQLLHILSLPHEAALERWCEQDAARFEDPLLLNNVKRCGSELLNSSPDRTDSAGLSHFV